MIKMIENTHEKLNLQLDTLPYEIVKKYEREGFKQELKAFKEAEDAAKKVTQFFFVYNYYLKNILQCNILYNITIFFTLIYLMYINE